MLFRNSNHHKLMLCDTWHPMVRILRRRQSLFAATLLATVCVSQVSAQSSSDGELPASPWSSRSTSTVRQPSAQVREPSNRTANVRVVETNESRVKNDSSNAESRPVSPRPAVVTMLGPVASAGPIASQPVQEWSEPTIDFPDTSAKHSSHSPTAPKHASTQTLPVEAQSNWQRVQAGGRKLEADGIDLGPSESQQPSEQSSSRTSPNLVKTTSTSASAPKRPFLLREGTDTESSTSAIDEASPTPTDELKVQRVAIAQRVSYELLSQNPYPPARTPEYLESPPGWGAIEQELKGRLERCDALLRRNAVHSARDEAIQGLRRLCRTMDAHRRSQRSMPALEKALTALREDADFASIQQNEILQSIISSHTTDALKGRVLNDLTSDMASQHYRFYAQYQFVQAADGHPWASDLLYAFGKTLEKEAEGDVTRSFMLRSQSVACYQAALQITPTQNDISNQLGFALIHLDRIDEAYQALHASLTQRPTSSAWNNLAEIYRRRGAANSADYAVQQAAAIAAQETHFTADNPQISEVDASTFAKYSPMPIQTPGANASPSAPQASVRSSSTSMFSKIFKR